MIDDPIRIRSDLTIPASELSFRASRSGGPGGQHANTSSTRVELVWDLEGSPSVTPAQRERIRERLGNRISGDGLLSLASSTTRSQHRNREEVTERFAELLGDALHVPKRRRKTKPSKSAREKRLKLKKQRSEKKRLRGPVTRD
ncbi:MAG: alternative ribosome rescue aminoacyl-tRNA hydrolase ArfB [Gemmatimonadota bacterium]